MVKKAEKDLTAYSVTVLGEAESAWSGAIPENVDDLVKILDSVRARAIAA